MQYRDDPEPIMIHPSYAPRYVESKDGSKLNCWTDYCDEPGCIQFMNGSADPIVCQKCWDKMHPPKEISIGADEKLLHMIGN